MVSGTASVGTARSKTYVLPSHSFKVNSTSGRPLSTIPVYPTLQSRPPSTRQAKTASSAVFSASPPTQWPGHSTQAAASLVSSARPATEKNRFGDVPNRYPQHHHAQASTPEPTQSNKATASLECGTQPLSLTTVTIVPPASRQCSLHWHSAAHPHCDRSLCLTTPLPLAPSTSPTPDNHNIMAAQAQVLGTFELLENILLSLPLQDLLLS